MNIVAESVGNLPVTGGDMKPDFGSQEYRYVISYRNRYLPNVPIYDKLPEGWSVIRGTTTQPRGTCWINNGPFFKLRREGMAYKSALMWL